MAFTPSMITIYSVGLLGGSLGLALKNSGFTGKIVDFPLIKILKLPWNWDVLTKVTHTEMENYTNTDLLFFAPLSTIIKPLKI